MRTLIAALLAAAASPACIESPDDDSGEPGFAGTWAVSRTRTTTECAFDFTPASSVRMLIEGNVVDGYTAVDAFNIGSLGNGGTLSVVDGREQLAVGFQEYWPGLGSQPDVAPGVGFVLWHDGDGLAGTSSARAYYSVDGELVPCQFDFTLTAIPAAPLE